MALEEIGISVDQDVHWDILDGVECTSDGFDGVCGADGAVWDDDANVKIAVCRWCAIGIRAKEIDFFSLDRLLNHFTNLF